MAIIYCSYDTEHQFSFLSVWGQSERRLFEKQPLPQSHCPLVNWETAPPGEIWVTELTQWTLTENVLSSLCDNYKCVTAASVKSFFKVTLCTMFFLFFFKCSFEKWIFCTYESCNNSMTSCRKRKPMWWTDLGCWSQPTLYFYLPASTMTLKAAPLFIRKWCGVGMGACSPHVHIWGHWKSSLRAACTALSVSSTNQYSPFMSSKLSWLSENTLILCIILSGNPTDPLLPFFCIHLVTFLVLSGLHHQSLC